MRPLADVLQAGAGGQEVAQLTQHVLGETLHPLRSSAHTDKLDIAEHLLEVVTAATINRVRKLNMIFVPPAEGEMVQHVLLHVLNVRIHQADALPATLASVQNKFLFEEKYSLMFVCQNFEKHICFIS